MLRVIDSAPVRINIDGRSYMVCDEKCYDVDGTELRERCGALVDVTDMPVVSVAACSCGKPSNHVSTYSGRTA